MAEQEIVDAEIVEETPAPQGPLKVAVIGNNLLSESTARAFNVPRGVEVETYTSEPDDIDRCLEDKPSVVFWCDEIGIKKNDTLDDADFLASLQKIIRGAGAGVCIRSAINMELHDRLFMLMTKEVVDAKIVYMPDLTDGTDTQSMIHSGMHVIGGSQDAIRAHMGILRSMSWFGAGKLQTGTFAEAVYTKLAVSGYRLVQQKFFDEVHDAVLDMKGANPMIVSRLAFEALNVSVLPSHVNGNDVYDARLFSGATDKLTLLESCLEN